MYYVYVLKIHGVKEKNYYIGYTCDLKKRIVEHINGLTKTTKNRQPELIYYEAYQDENLARQREWRIKHSGSVYNALMKRVKLK